MSPQSARWRYDDYEELLDGIDDEWQENDGTQRIRRRERTEVDDRPRRDGKRKRERRWEPPPHKREEH